MIKITLILSSILLLTACKEKNIVTENVNTISRDQYAMASSYAFILLCDSAANRTSRAVLEPDYLITYDENVNNLFNLYESLGKKTPIEAVKFEIRQILHKSLKEMAFYPSSLMHLAENDEPDDMLRSDLLVRKFLEPNIDSLQHYLVSKMSFRFELTQAYKHLETMNSLNNNYYNKNNKITFNFSDIAKKAAWTYLETSKNLEAEIKNNYNNWNNKDAALIMASIKK